MNEGMYYVAENNEVNPETALRHETEKSSILARLSLAGFVSHMELTALSDVENVHSTHDSVDAALYELEQSGQIIRTYETTDQQNVLIGYTLTD